MSKVFISILLLFLTFSLYGEDGQKNTKGTNQEKAQTVDSKKDLKKSDEKTEKKEADKKSDEKKSDEKDKKAQENKKVQNAVIQTENSSKAQNESAKQEEKKDTQNNDVKNEDKKSEEKKVTEKKEVVDETEKENVNNSSVEEKNNENAKELTNNKEEESIKADLKLKANEKKSAQAKSENKKPKKYSLTMVLNSSLGQGTFVYDEYARNPLFSQTLMIAPGYRYKDISMRMSISASMEYTKSDSTTHANQLIFSDLGLSASKGLYTFKDSGVSLRGSLKILLPTSMASQKATLYFASVLGLQVTKSFGKVTLGYSGSFKKNFNEYSSPVIRRDDLTDFNTYGREGGAEILEKNMIATGSNNVSHSLTNGLMLNYSVNDNISFGMNVAYSVAWVYRSYDNDDLTADNAETGTPYRDILIGGIDLGWQLTKNLGLSFGISTAQLPKTSDQKGFRFPWFNFSTPADNSSMFFVDINATF